MHRGPNTVRNEKPDRHLKETFRVNYAQNQLISMTSKLFLCFLSWLSLAIWTCSPSSNHNEFNKWLVFEHDGKERRAIVHDPATRETKRPLILALHGYGGQAEDLRYATEMDSLADLHGFVICYPQGTLDATGMPHWNADFEWTNVDDLGYFERLIDRLISTHGVDPRRVYCCGFSNGGYMSYALACHMPDQIRALGSVAGIMSPGTHSKCAAQQQVPSIQFSGLRDSLIPYTDDVPYEQFAGSMNTPELVAWIGERLSTASTENDILTNFNPLWGRVEIETHRNSYGEAVLQHITYENGKHTWFEGTSEMLFDFFRAQD